MGQKSNNISNNKNLFKGKFWRKNAKIYLIEKSRKLKKKQRLRNDNSEGSVSFFRPHLVIEEKKEVWILCESSITAMGIGAMMKRSYPNYKSCLCNRETFLHIGGQL